MTGVLKDFQVANWTSPRNEKDTFQWMAKKTFSVNLVVLCSCFS